MRQVKSGHLCDTERARPIESIKGKHESITLYHTRSRLFFLHIVGDVSSLCSGYDKEHDCLITGEKILPVSWEEGQRILQTFKEREQKQ